MILTYKHGRGNKVHLSIDGEYVISTTDKVWYESGYANNSEISSEEWEDFCEKINFEKMYERALDLLDLRDHSEREILDKLTQKFGYDKREQAKYVCDKLSENGLLDDEHFARIYATELINRKHVSTAGLRAALSAKGISRDITSLIIEEMSPDPYEAIGKIIDSRFASYDLLDENKCDKIITHLYRKGFLMCDIREVLEDRRREIKIAQLDTPTT